jgi:hypothetical protein
MSNTTTLLRPAVFAIAPRLHRESEDLLLWEAEMRATLGMSNCGTCHVTDSGSGTPRFPQADDCDTNC